MVLMLIVCSFIIKCSSLKKKIVVQNDKLYRQNKHTNEERKRENK